jgi:hypothetical protein
MTLRKASRPLLPSDLFGTRKGLQAVAGFLSQSSAFTKCSSVSFSAHVLFLFLFLFCLWLRALCNRPRSYAPPDVHVSSYASVWLVFVTLVV